jgi:predicted nucleic acid-binding protein
MALGVDTTFLVQVEIAESAGHAKAMAFLEGRVIGRRQALAVAPQALLELVHIVTDGKRFQRPLTMEKALERSAFWWNAREVRQALPTAETFRLFHDWMRANALGRKRILDTFLAATYMSLGIREILSSNARDYAILPGISLIDPAG